MKYLIKNKISKVKIKTIYLFFSNLKFLYFTKKKIDKKTTNKSGKNGPEINKKIIL